MFELVRKCHFCALNESTDNLQVDEVKLSALHALCSDTCWRHSPIDVLFNSKRMKIYLGMKSVKLLLVFEVSI